MVSSSIVIAILSSSSQAVTARAPASISSSPHTQTQLPPISSRVQVASPWFIINHRYVGWGGWAASIVPCRSNTHHIHQLLARARPGALSMFIFIRAAFNFDPSSRLVYYSIDSICCLCAQGSTLPMGDGGGMRVRACRRAAALGKRPRTSWTTACERACRSSRQGAPGKKRAHGIAAAGAGAFQRHR